MRNEEVEDMTEASTDQAPIAIRALEHFGYCPRQCSLIHVDRVWVDNEFTVKGQAGHRRADSAAPRVERGRLVVRNMEVWNDELNITGRADAVEFQEDGIVIPVEYKIGTRHGITADLQVCAQALCLETMFGIDVSQGAIWYSGTRRRITIELDSQLRAQTLETIHRIRDLITTAKLPPAVNDARCLHCQLVSHCLPNLVADPHAVAKYFDTEIYTCAY